MKQTSETHRYTAATKCSAGGGRDQRLAGSSRHSEAHLLFCHLDSKQYHVQLYGKNIGEKTKQKCLSTVKRFRNTDSVVEKNTMM